jgi:hypothetical protein
MSLLKLARAIGRTKLAYGGDYFDYTPSFGDSYNETINAERAAAAEAKKSLIDRFYQSRAQKVQDYNFAQNMLKLKDSQSSQLMPSAALAQGEFSRDISAPKSWAQDLANDIQFRANVPGASMPSSGFVPPPVQPVVVPPVPQVMAQGPGLFDSISSAAKGFSDRYLGTGNASVPADQLALPGIPEMAQGPGFLDNIGSAAKGFATEYLTPRNIGYGAGALALAGGAYGIKKLFDRSKRRAREEEMAHLARMESLRNQTRGLQPFYQPYLDQARPYINRYF